MAIPQHPHAPVGCFQAGASAEKVAPSSCDAVNQTWEKWYGAPMLAKVVPNPYF